MSQTHISRRVKFRFDNVTIYCVYEQRPGDVLMHDGSDFVE